MNVIPSKALMKILFALMFWMMLLVSCGGGTDSNTTNGTGSSGNTPAFEAPPTPGAK